MRSVAGLRSVHKSSPMDGICRMNAWACSLVMAGRMNTPLSTGVYILSDSNTGCNV